jgi:hypothetical protein
MMELTHGICLQSEVEILKERLSLATDEKDVLVRDVNEFRTVLQVKAGTMIRGTMCEISITN